MAMFGWYYGGYAAAVAAARTPQIYQCVVAGAAVFDTLMQVNYFRFRLRGTGLVEQINTRDDSVLPIKEVANVNVPMLIHQLQFYTALLDFLGNDCGPDGL